MPTGWRQLLVRIRRDRRSGASTLLARGLEAARVFLLATRNLPPARFAKSLERFTLRLVQTQPSMATFLTLANALWLGRRKGDLRPGAWRAVHDALIRYAEGIDRNLEATLRRAAILVRPRSRVLTYSNSTAVRLALWRAMGAGRRFEVVCAESRPMREGVSLARDLADLGISVHLVVDAALPAWVSRVDLVLLGADAILRGTVVNKMGTNELLQAARRARVASYVLADSSKWLPDPLTSFWRIRDEAPGEIARIRHPNLTIHNRYFDCSPLALFTGVVWEAGVTRPGEVARRIVGLPVSKALMKLLAGGRAAGHRGDGHRTARARNPIVQ